MIQEESCTKIAHWGTIGHLAKFMTKLIMMMSRT
jgi:hypothetical protein